MRILVTGVTGFVGGHLAESLFERPGVELVGTSRTGEWPGDLTHLAGKVRLVRLDLADAAAAEAVVRDVRPAWLFHLAGYANTGRSFLQPAACWADNLDGTRHLYDAIVRSGERPRVLFASTGLVYGDPDEPGRACDERTTLKPASPYAASKAAADLLSYQYARTAKLDVVRARLFNQIGPRQSADYAVANFARQIAAAEAGLQASVLRTGPLTAERDVTDVRDVVGALAAALERGEAGEAYNVGRGRTYPVRELLDRLIRLARVPVEVRAEDAGRAGDTAVVRADAGRLRALTGWEPRRPLDETLADVLDDWRRRTPGGAGGR